jgi:antitoxin component YwqK of YwqJK toxin-antitoxin module
MKRLFAISLIAASLSVAYAQTPFDITKSATVAAKEAKITCKKLAVAPKSCVIAYFDEDFEVSKKASEYYRVLDGKTADGQFIATDYYSSGQRQSDTFTTSNRQALLTAGDNERLGMTQKSFTTYHENGAKSESVDMIDGLASGTYQSWYENDTKKSEGTTKNNQIGEWTYWDENGKVNRKGSFNDDGKPTGEWTYWQENGNVRFKGSFNDDGNRTGEWIEWDESGEKIHTYEFDNDELISIDGVAEATAVAAVEVEAASVADDATTQALDADAAAEDLDTRCITFKRADQCVIAFFDKNSNVQKTAKNAAFYRVLYGKVNDLYIVQDFFANGNKQSNVTFMTRHFIQQ